MYHFFAGRVESDEGSPNSIYKTSSTGFYAYEDSGEASVRAIAYSVPTSSNNSLYVETGTSTADDDVQFKEELLMVEFILIMVPLLLVALTMPNHLNGQMEIQIMKIELDIP